MTFNTLGYALMYIYFSDNCNNIVRYVIQPLKSFLTNEKAERQKKLFALAHMSILQHRQEENKVRFQFAILFRRPPSLYFVLQLQDIFLGTAASFLDVMCSVVRKEWS